MSERSIDDILNRFNDMNADHAKALIEHLEQNPELKDERCINPLIGVIAHSDRNQNTGAAGGFVKQATALLIDRFGAKAVEPLAMALSEVAGIAISYRESAIAQHPVLKPALNQEQELLP